MTEELKRLTFGECLLHPTIAGTKKITLRKYHPDAHDFTQGQVIIGEFKDGMNLLLEITADTQTKPFSDLTDEEAREDGYEDAQDAWGDLPEYYEGNFAKTDMMAIIRFQVLRVQGAAVVQFNEHL